MDAAVAEVCAGDVTGAAADGVAGGDGDGALAGAAVAVGAEDAEDAAGVAAAVLPPGAAFSVAASDFDVLAEDCGDCAGAGAVDTKGEADSVDDVDDSGMSVRTASTALVPSFAIVATTLATLVPSVLVRLPSVPAALSLIEDKRESLDLTSVTEEVTEFVEAVGTAFEPEPELVELGLPLPLLPPLPVLAGVRS